MGIADAQHLTVLDSLQREIQATINEYNRRASGLTDKDELLAIRIEENDALREVLRKQRRHLEYMTGRPIEPEVHSVEAVLIAVGGLETP